MKKVSLVVAAIIVLSATTFAKGVKQTPAKETIKTEKKEMKEKKASHKEMKAKKEKMAK